MEIDHLREWIGRRTERRDRVSERLVAEFRATLAPHIAETGDAAPPGLFWCLAPETVAAQDLGSDGHARLGLTLPPVPFGRRMWAGGEVHFHGGLAPGDEIEKVSTIEDIALKTGSTGRLCFVHVRHRYSVDTRLVIDERQDIVYRENAAAAKPPPAPQPPPSGWTVTPAPVMLFRYSALIFNGHRIHYDHPYATGTEGYDGLVVHGPLQATLMLNLVTATLGRLPQRFSYRGLAPLTGAAPFTVTAEEGGLTARVVSAAGVVTMTAET